MSGNNLTVADEDNVTCIFDDKETEGFVINGDEVLCIFTRDEENWKNTF